MNRPKCDDLDYIHFLIAAQRVFTCSEAARCQPEGDQAPAHDAFTRLLQRQPPDTAALWQEAKAFVNLRKGLLILDDTTLDQPYARRMDRVTYHWSGKHQGVVKGIALLTLLWTAGQALIPLVYRRQSVPKGIVLCDFRVYDKPQGGKTKYTVVLFPLHQVPLGELLPGIVYRELPAHRDLTAVALSHPGPHLPL